MATELLFYSFEVPDLSEDRIIPYAVVPQEFSGTHMRGAHLYIRNKNIGTEEGNLWLMDVGVLTPSASYQALSSTLPVVAGRGTHFWEQEIDFPQSAMIAFRFRTQGFPTMLNAMSVMPHIRIRGGRDNAQE